MYANWSSVLPREFEKWPADYHIFEYGAILDNSPLVDGRPNPELQVSCLRFLTLILPHHLQRLYSRVDRYFQLVPDGRPAFVKPWERAEDVFGAPSPLPASTYSSHTAS